MYSNYEPINALDVLSRMFVKLNGAPLIIYLSFSTK